MDLEKAKSAFNELFLVDGGVVSEVNAILGKYRNRYIYYLNTYKSQPLYSKALQSTYFEYISNIKFNACSAKAQGYDFIGFYYGTIFYLETLFLLLLSHPGVLPDIGNPEKEKACFKDLSHLDWDENIVTNFFSGKVNSEIPKNIPKDPRRKEMALNLAMLAIDFLFFHALGHIIHGHLDYLSDISGKARLEELPQQTSINSVEYQLLELNADVSSVLITSLEWHKLESLTPLGFDNTFQVLRMWSFAVSVLFMAYKRMSPTNYLYQHSTHPHPTVRIINAWNMSISNAGRISEEARGNMMDVWIHTFKDLEIVATLLKISEPNWNIFSKQAETFFDDYNKLTKNWHFVFKDIPNYTRLILEGIAAETVPNTTPVSVDEIEGPITINRGLVRRRQENYDLAITDFSRVIKLLEVANETKAIAFLNRGDTYFDKKEFDLALKDFQAVAELKDISEKTKTKAQASQSWIWGDIANSYLQKKDFFKAKDIYSKVLSLEGTSPELKIIALSQRAFANINLNFPQEAMSDYTVVIEKKQAPDDLKAEALCNRGSIYEELGQLDKALEDYSSVILMKKTDQSLIAWTRFGRGNIYRGMQKFDSAVVDYSKVIEIPNCSTAQLINSLFFRGIIFNNIQNKQDKAIADFTKIIEHPSTPSSFMTKVLFERGSIFLTKEQYGKALEDFTAIIKTPGAPLNNRIDSLLNRAEILRKQGNINKTIRDYTSVIEMPELSNEKKAQVLIWRGTEQRERKAYESAISDLNLVIKMPTISDKLKADALIERGFLYIDIHKIEEAFKDFKSVTEIPNVDSSNHDAAREMLSILKGKGL